jgi:protein gp37
MRSLVAGDLYDLVVAELSVGTGHLEQRLVWPLPNVWLGVSVEDQKWADIRIPALQATPAAVRFLSCEPLLGPIDLDPWQSGGPPWSGIHWVIVGGESGSGARPMHPAWPRSLRDQCVEAGVPFLFKQWGAWAPHDSRSMRRVGKKTAGRELDGRTWDQYPQAAA